MLKNQWLFNIFGGKGREGGRRGTGGDRSKQEIFIMFFNAFCVLEGAIFVLYRVFFRFVFCIDFWSPFGPILVSFLDAFGRPNQSFLASIFG